MINKLLKNKKGLTLLQIIFAVAVIIAITVLVSSMVTSSNAKKRESEITSSLTQLESSARSYFINKNEYPVKEAINLKDTTVGTPQRMFFDELVKISGFTIDNINDRVKYVDTQVLLSENYLSSDVLNAEDYVLDKKTGKVYNINRDMKLKDIQKVIKKLISDAGDVIELKKNAEFALEKNGKKMSRVITTVTQGNKMVVGGDGTMKLALVTLSENKDKVDEEIKDLTFELKGTAPEAVTELVLVDTNKVLVHYFDGAELAYLTLNF